MSKKRALFEIAVISVLIPLALWAFLHFWMYIRYSALLPLFFFVMIPLAYSYFVFFRHKEKGMKFILLNALAGTVIHCIVLYALLATELSRLGLSGDKGHPNGMAVLVFMLLIFEPFVINLVPLILWIGKKIICLFITDDK